MEAIEANVNVLLHSLERHDVVLLPNVGAVPLLRMLDSVFDEDMLFVCDNKRLECISDYKLNDDNYYDLRSTGSILWLSYDLLWFNLVKDSQFLKRFKLVIFDGIDDRQLISDLVLGIIVNFKVEMQNCLVLLKSSAQLKPYVEYFGKSFTVGELNLMQLPDVEFYHNNADNYHKEIIQTINKIVQSDNTIYDIIILLPSYKDLRFLRDYHLVLTDYSVVNRIEDYAPPSNQQSKRLIFAAKATDFVNLGKTSVKYVIDSAILNTVIVDKTNTSINQQTFKTTSIRNIQNNISSVLSTTNKTVVKYFILTDKSKLEKNCCGIQNGSELLIYLPGLIKLLNERNLELNGFFFFSKPDEKILRSSINQLIYLGLLRTKESFKGIQVTERTYSLLHYHYTKNEENFNLFLSLTYNDPQNVQLLEVLTVWNVLNHGALRNYFKAVRSENDFDTMVELFEKFDTNAIKLHFESHSDLKKSLKQYFKNLKTNHDNNSWNYNIFKYQTLMESVACGFQFKLCVVEDDNQNIHPILSTNDTEDSSIKTDRYYHSGDAVLVSSIIVSHHPDIEYQTPIFSTKVPKQLLYEIGLPLIKLK